VSPDLDRLCARLERCRRLLVVAGAEVLHGQGGPRAAIILREMERFFEAFLVVSEGQGGLLDEAGLEAVHREEECAPGSPLALFLQVAPPVCLVLGAQCSGAASALAVATVWRAGGWIVELGRTPSELGALAREIHRGDPEELLDELWESFLTGSCDEPERRGVRAG
jgi:hypothetical protein